jgi:REP element-mobilizing transposase RayT
MSYVRIWIHLVFSTKYRNALLSKDIRQDVFEHIRLHGAAKGIFVKAIGGHVDHVHCLLSIGNMQTIADVAQLIKGESSFWINKCGMPLPVRLAERLLRRFGQRVACKKGGGLHREPGKASCF